MPKFSILALYHFATLDNYVEIKEPLLKCMKDNNVKGSLLLASEGINGTISGSKENVYKVLKYIQNDTRLANTTYKESFADESPFERSKVLLKKEIVTMGVPGTDPTKIVGSYVKPKDWNDLISDPNTVVIDTRNEYETSIGTFKNAIDPHTETFREFPKYVHDEMSKIDRDKKVAMFCTGGIRCEKSTAFMKEQGFKNVYHLEGGILKYLEEVPQEESLWEGECFVFDNRVAVKHGLEQGKYDQCYACRMPITEDDKERKEYTKGVSCHHCHNTKTAAQLESYKERHKQVELAKQRKQKHIGGDVNVAMEQNRQKKADLKEKTRGPLANKHTS